MTNNDIRRAISEHAYHLQQEREKKIQEIRKLEQKVFYEGQNDLYDFVPRDVIVISAQQKIGALVAEIIDLKFMFENDLKMLEEMARPAHTQEQIRKKFSLLAKEMEKADNDLPDDSRQSSAPFNPSSARSVHGHH